MAVDTCMRGHTKDKGLPCNQCAAEAIARASADLRPPDDLPDLRWDGPPSGGVYLPTSQARYEDLLLAVCLAHEAAEFGASLNRAAGRAGADLDRGGRVEVTALRGFACRLAGNVRGVISRDRENGFGPGSGGMSDWEEEFESYTSAPSPREARRGDGIRLRLLADRLGRLLQRVAADMDDHEALGRARRAVAEWPRLLPWAFGLCAACGRECDGAPDARDAVCAPCMSRRLDEEARAAAEPECPRCGGGLWAPTNTGGALVCGTCLAEFPGMPDADPATTG